MATRTWRIAGINFDHMHMGDLLRMARTHPGAEIVGICDEVPARMATAKAMLGVDDGRVFTDAEECLDKTRPDVVILCPATARHAEYVERVVPFGAAILVEKPFAASLAEADRMIAACERNSVPLAINWPLRWVASHCTAERLVREGRIGELQEVHYYNGNRGPLYHGADKTELEPTTERKQKSWFYKRAEGGGSLLDYLGYGITLGTWFHGGKRPREVSSVWFVPPGVEVDEHSITVVRYDCGLSKFETRWGTFTDPWKHQPQPKCGFVLKGSDGTISSYDYESNISLQTRENPEVHTLAADSLQAPVRNPIEYYLHCLENGEQVSGPLSPAMSRLGQEIVDAAFRSAQSGSSVKFAAC